MGKNNTFSDSDSRLILIFLRLSSYFIIYMYLCRRI